MLFNLAQLREVEVCDIFDFSWTDDSADLELMVCTTLVAQVVRILSIEVFIETVFAIESQVLLPQVAIIWLLIAEQNVVKVALAINVTLTIEHAIVDLWVVDF